MADTYQFWIHGVNVFAKETPHLTGIQNELHMKPYFDGTKVRQAPGENWFFLPIPTPTHLDDWKSWNKHAYLRVKIGSQVEINKVQIFSNTATTDKEEIYVKDYQPNELRSRDEQLDFNIDDRKRALGPLVMCVRVRFDNGSDEDRTILFKGAGATFIEARSP